eukprot:scaffold250563_cov31-Tisochrysis_lutea.AAC.1
MNLGAMQGYSYVAADDSSSLHTFDGTCHGRRRPSPLVLNVVYIAMRSLLAANNGTNATRAQMYREMCNIMRRAWLEIAWGFVIVISPHKTETRLLAGYFSSPTKFIPDPLMGGGNISPEWVLLSSVVVSILACHVGDRGMNT